MSKDQTYGGLILLVSIIIVVVYLVAFFGPYVPGFNIPSSWHDIAVGIPVLLFVLMVLAISGWIGFTMLTTPPPAPLEPEPAKPAATTEQKK